MVLMKKSEPELTKKLIEKLVFEFSQFFNLSKPMTGTQIEQTAELILEEYAVLKPDDLILCFKNVKKGMYGQVTSAMDGTKIMEYLNIYTNKRADFYVQLNIKKEQERRKKENEVEKNTQSELASSILKDVILEIEKNKIEKIISKPVVHDPMQKFVNKWINQFQKLKTKYVFGHSREFIKIGNSTFDLTSFVNHKFENYIKKTEQGKNHA